MPKRKGSSGITGGTGDVNPQWFLITTIAGASGTYADASTTLPRERLPYGNKSQVMEVLKVHFFLDPALTLTATAISVFTSLRQYLLTKSFGTTEPTAPSMGGQVIAFRHFSAIGTAAAPAVMMPMGSYEDIQDLTDGAGHGVLVATDTVSHGQNAVNLTFGGTNKLLCRVLYRWKNVSLAEYIGIVQSQQ